MEKRIFIVLVAMIAIILLLVGRIIYIQVHKGNTYQKIVLNQQEYNSITIPYRRGDIVDRKGTVLATSTDVYNVILDCYVLNSKEKFLEPTMKVLKDQLGLNTETIRSYVKDHPKARYYVIAKKISYNKMSKIKKIMEDTKNNPNIKGIWFEKEYIRTHPYPKLASSLLGFTTAGNVGIGGIEDYYNSTLNGTNGREYGYLNTDSSYEKTVKEAVNGNTVQSTIDVNLQTIVQDKIKDFAKRFATNSGKTNAAKHIGVIMMDPNTGEILAMANYPTFSLNNAWDLSDYYSKSDIDKMSEKERLKNLNDIWQNFCLSYTYEPGSTAKPFTISAGLDTGKLKGNETFYCPGYLNVAGQIIHCDNHQGHGIETISDALRDSCNVSLMHMGFKVGAKDFSRYQQIFNLGLKTNIDLPGEARTDGLIYSEDSLENKVNLATNAFGQNFNVTMIQMISGYNSIVNGGKYYLPHVLNKVLDEHGNTVKKVDPILLRNTISKTTSQKLISYLQEVVKAGTGKKAKVEGYSMTGKTGTAEKHPRGKGNYLVSFIGAVPAKKPKVSIYCVVDEPNTSNQAHSTYAQEIVNNILKEALPYLNISKDE